MKFHSEVEFSRGKKKKRKPSIFFLERRIKSFSKGHYHVCLAVPSLEALFDGDVLD